MSIATALGLKKKVRYAIVALGDIAQEALLPGVAHTGNSEVTALVTGDPVKAREVGALYGIETTCGYDGFDALLASGRIDAIYLATPNWRHAEFAVPALKAGIHVLCEKPLEISMEKAQPIVDAARKSAAKLMVAYRLHFEPATLDTIERIRAGELGDLVMFTSCFAQMVDPENHRVRNGALAGPLLDMAPYPINAMRYLFGDEPTEVVAAVAARHPESRFGDLDDTVSATLRFPGGRIGQFIVSYYANSVGSLVIAGTKGSIQLDPAFTFGAGLEQWRTIGDQKSHETFKATDQFGGELRYFSDCILDDVQPEPDVDEGLADLRVTDGIARSLASGRPETLPPFERTRRIEPSKQKQTLSLVPPPDLVRVKSPAAD